MREGSQSAKATRSRSQPLFTYSSTAFAQNNTSCPVHCFGQDQETEQDAYLWTGYQDFDGIADGKGTAQTLCPATTNLRSRNGFTQQLLCALCWVRPASQPSFSLPSTKTRPCSLISKAVAYFLLFNLQRVSQFRPPVDINPFETNLRREQ